jgi:hypothetical protein
MNPNLVPEKHSENFGKVLFFKQTFFNGFRQVDREDISPNSRYSNLTLVSLTLILASG